MVCERVHNGKRMCSLKNRTFSLLICGRKFVRGRVHDRKRMCGSKSHRFSLLFCGRGYTRGRENMRLEEPHTAHVRFLEPHVYVLLTAYCKHEVLRTSHICTANWVIQMCSS